MQRSGTPLGRRGVLAAAMAALVAGGLAPAARADWPVYGHDLANSRDAGAAGPTPGDARSLKQAWSFASPTGDFTGTPVVAGGVVVAADQGGVAYALDAVSGKQLWSRDLGAPVHASAAIDTDAPGGPVALVPVGEVGAPRLVALELGSGAVRFKTTLTRQDGADIFGSPTFHDGVAYVGTSASNGDASTARGTVTALDEATGAVRWQTYSVPPGHDGGPVWSTPSLDTATGRLYVGTGNAYHDPAADTTDAVLALDADTGRILGHFQATAGDSFAGNDNPAGPDADFGASPNLLGGGLVGEGAKSGIYWALDRDTLKPAWRTMVGPALQIGGILGSTAYDGARVYGTDAADGQVWALGRDDGKSAWMSADPGTADFSPVAVAHGVLYTVDPGGSLVTRDAATGSMLGSASLGGPSFGGVSVDGGAVYAAVGTGPPPSPAPQADGKGAIVAFRDTSRSGPPRVEFGVHFTTRAPGAPTGLDMRIQFNRPGDPNGKPTPLRSAVVHGPDGLRFDTTAVTRCTASDEELHARGSDACPADSRLAVGTFSAMTGTPADPLAGDDHVFNGDNQLLEVITAPGASFSPGFDRLTISGSTLTAHPPTTPGAPPDNETSIKAIAFKFGPRGKLVTTPESCPAGGEWTTTGTFGFADGTTETVRSSSPCDQPGAASGRTRGASTSARRPRMRLVLSPRRVHAGRTVRLHVSLASSTRCRSAATVRLAGRHVRTDRRGRATLKV